MDVVLEYTSASSPIVNFRSKIPKPIADPMNLKVDVIYEWPINNLKTVNLGHCSWVPGFELAESEIIIVIVDRLAKSMVAW